MSDLLRLRPYQAKALERICAHFPDHSKDVDAPRRIAAVLPTGCHRAGQRVLMYDGSTRAVEDVQVGDMLMGPDSTPREVLSLARGVGHMMTVQPVKGDPWVVNDQHVLTLVQTSTRSESSGRRRPCERRSGTVSDVVVSEWMNWSKSRKHIHKLFRVGVEFPTRPAPELDPYFLGVLLGDGHLTKPYAVAVSKPDPEITAVCEDVAQQYGLRVRRDGENGITHHIVGPRGANGRRGGSNRVVTLLQEMGLLPISGEDRFVPEGYKLGSREVRLAVLAGLLDTDAALSRAGFDFGSKSERLAGDVAFIARSLGLAAYVTKRPSGHYRVSISGDCSIIPTRIPRKQSPPRRQVKDPLRTGFTVTPTGTEEPYYGFHLSGDHRYLLDDFTVTHNSGKTVLFAHLAKRWIEYEHTFLKLPARVLILVHRDELVTQAVDKLRQVAPGVPVGVVKAERNDIDHDVIVASVQTLARAHRLEQVPPVGLVIVDECHHASSSSYRAVLEHFGCYSSAADSRDSSSSAVAVGFTATMARGDGRGLGDVWQEVVYRLDILDLIEQGHLVDVAGRRVTVDGLTLENVVTRGGDYAPTSLSEALMSADAMRVTADAYEKYAKDRSGIVFVPNVEAVHAFVEEFQRRGVQAAPVWGAMGSLPRRQTLEWFKQGRIQVLVNCAVLTEGFDAPIASCAVIARPTLSAALYVQMVGRVLRPYPGKTDALVLDVAGASEMHQLATLADLSTRRLDEVREGESLTAAVRREREAGNPRLADYIVDSYEVDLFRRSEALWLQTKAGVWFTTTKDPAAETREEREQVYFLWPGSEPDLYRVGKRPLYVAGGSWIAEDVPFNVAQEWAEQAAFADDAKSRENGGHREPSVALKNAPWRRNRQPASPNQLARLKRYGITPRDGITKREASDLISIELASRVLDQAIAGRK